jgi:hypothetical protein
MGTLRPITMMLGENRTMVATVSDANGERVDLTGCVVHFGLKASLAAETYDIQKVSSDPAEVEILTQTGATLGQANVYLVPADTASLAAGKYFYDLWVVDALGNQYALFEPSQLILGQPVTIIP